MAVDVAFSQHSRSHVDWRVMIEIAWEISRFSWLGVDDRNPSIFLHAFVDSPDSLNSFI